MQSMSVGRIVTFLVLILAVAATASADTVRVIADRALVWTQPGGVSIVMNQLLKGQTAEVVRRIGDWYEIVAPPGSGGGDRRTGFISASQVVLESGRPSSQRARQTRPPARTARVRPPFSRIFTVGAGYQAGTDLTQSFTSFTDVFAEAGSIATNFGKRSGLAINALFAQPLRGQFGVGVGFDAYLRNQAANVDARVPHPFFFNQLRTATFETSGLSARDAALNIPLVWMPPARRKVRILAFGGPTIFHVSQAVVTSLALDSQYPYDTVSITSVRTGERTKTLLGYHVGGDVSYFFTPSRRAPRGASTRPGPGYLIGLGVDLHYSHAKMRFNNDVGVTTEGSAGGFSVATGLRFGF
jgi:hypothetical protein